LHERVSLRNHFHQDPAYAIIVADALAELPVEQRDAVVVIDMLRCSVAEACLLLHVPPLTIKIHCSRGRAKPAPLLEGVRRAGWPGPGVPPGTAANDAVPPGVVAIVEPSARRPR